MFAHTNIYKYFDKRIYKYWKTFKAKSDEGQTLGSWIKNKYIKMHRLKFNGINTTSMEFYI